MGQGGVACPKPERGSDRIARRRRREAEATAFRDKVWKRATNADGEPHCEVCGFGRLLRTRDILHPRAGHVAHARGRRVAPEDKYNPDAATLQCSRCHLASHSMRFA